MPKRKAPVTLKRLLCLSAVLAVCVTMLTVAVGATSAVWHNYPTLGATSGDVFTYELGSGSFTVGSEGSPSQFVGISIGGYVLSSNVYVVAGEVCNITISGSYLGSFDPGDYPLRIVFKDGETNATLKIIKSSETPATSAPASPAPATSSTASQPEPGMLEGGAAVEGPKTGFNTIMLGFIALSGGSAALFGLGKKWLSI